MDVNQAKQLQERRKKCIAKEKKKIVKLNTERIIYIHMCIYTQERDEY